VVHGGEGMILAINKEMIAHAYDYLCCCEPFCRWNMPDSEDIAFGIYRRKDRYAHYEYKASGPNEGRHHIKISSALVGSHASLLSTLAHEMLHLHLNNTGCMDMRALHGAGFNKLADRVCNIHGFDRLTF
jgi:hypothetical protein